MRRPYRGSGVDAPPAEASRNLVLDDQAHLAPVGSDGDPDDMTLDRT